MKVAWDVREDRRFVMEGVDVCATDRVDDAADVLVLLVLEEPDGVPDVELVFVADVDPEFVFVADCDCVFDLVMDGDLEKEGEGVLEEDIRADFDCNPDTVDVAEPDVVELKSLLVGDADRE